MVCWTCSKKLGVSDALNRLKQTFWIKTAWEARVRNPRKKTRTQSTSMWYSLTCDTSSMLRQKKCNGTLSKWRHRMSKRGNWSRRIRSTRRIITSTRKMQTRSRHSIRALNRSSAYCTNRKRTYLTALRTRWTRLSSWGTNFCRRSHAAQRLSSMCRRWAKSCRQSLHPNPNWRAKRKTFKLMVLNMSDKTTWISNSIQF